MHTHTFAEWAQMVSLSVGLYAAASAPYFLLIEAEVWAWPRPLTAAVDRARPAAQRAGDRLLVTVANARLDARETAAEGRRFVALSLREAALTVTALYALLTITPETTR
jgi:hypothetical protein